MELLFIAILGLTLKEGLKEAKVFLFELLKGLIERKVIICKHLVVQNLKFANLDLQL